MKKKYTFVIYVFDKATDKVELTAKNKTKEMSAEDFEKCLDRELLYYRMKGKGVCYEVLREPSTFSPNRNSSQPCRLRANVLRNYVDGFKMKTINGAPQFETEDFEKIIAPTNAYTLDHQVNEYLRDWAASRVCTKCFYKLGEICINTKIKFGLGLLNPEKFSCQAFEAKK